VPENGNDYGYGREKLYLAINSLATGTGSIQKRLETVAIGMLGLTSFQELLPPELMPELKAILQDLTKIPGPDGAIVATTQAMSDEEGAAIAERILSLYIELRGGI
jgi:hypothetical protein